MDNDGEIDEVNVESRIDDVVVDGKYNDDDDDDDAIVAVDDGIGDDVVVLGNIVDNKWDTVELKIKFSSIRWLGDDDEESE